MTFIDRTGWRYQAVLSGRTYTVEGLTIAGWALKPDQRRRYAPKRLLRSRDVLDDATKWMRVA
jgi:hypothetical protein